MIFQSFDNTLNGEFQKKYLNLRDAFFSRDPNKWPMYNDPTIHEVIAFRKENHRENNIDYYHNADALFKTLNTEETIPFNASPPKDIQSTLAFCAGLSKNWEDPSAVENVACMPSDAAIYGSFMALVASPNLVHREYCRMSDNLENAVIKMMSTLAKYDPNKSAGIFTQGGTFCNLYGYLLGIRKNLPSVQYHGMESSSDFRIINSQGGHYSNITNLSLLGVSIKEKTIRIKVEENNDIDLKDLEYQLEACFRLHCIVPTIMLTAGTTDTFGVDRIKPVYDIRERLCKKYELHYKPHIHVDSAVGWTLLFFLDYDFKGNPLDINPQTLAGIELNVKRFSDMHYADSITIDFHKWGYVPYTSSLVIIKNKDDLKVMENEPDNFQYFEKETQGHTHLQSTIECSRGAVGLYGAYSGLKFIGVQGYQTLIAHCLQNANYFRCQLLKKPNIIVLSSENQGPSVGFRIYNPLLVENAEEEFDFEFNKDTSQEYLQRLARNTQYHRSIFEERGKKGLYTDWVGTIAHTTYDEINNFIGIPGEKAVFLNPLTSRKEIDAFIAVVC